MRASGGGTSALPGAEEGRLLLLTAREELHAHFGIAKECEASEFEWALPLGGVFATLELEGELRGCIGYFHRGEDIFTLTRRAVIAAALDDPRFGSVQREEVPRLAIRITVLAPPIAVSEISEIVIGRDGVLVERSGARGLLLPRVALKRGWDPEVFVSQCCRKAGLSADAWRDGGTLVRRFEAVEFEE